MAPDQIASLKIREGVGGYHEYHELLHRLEHDAGLRSRSVQGNFQGNGHLVESAKSKVIIVEHETGLEILYIAGSIASLLSLIPLILRGWDAIRNHDRRSRPSQFKTVETRTLDHNGKLVEESNSALSVPWAAPLSIMNTALLSAAEVIDAEVQHLRDEVRRLAKRVSDIDLQLGATQAMPSQRRKRKNP